MTQSRVDSKAYTFWGNLGLTSVQSRIQMTNLGNQFSSHATVISCDIIISLSKDIFFKDCKFDVPALKQKTLNKWQTLIFINILLHSDYKYIYFIFFEESIMFPCRLLVTDDQDSLNTPLHLTKTQDPFLLDRDNRSQTSLFLEHLLQNICNCKFFLCLCEIYVSLSAFCRCYNTENVFPKDLGTISLKCKHKQRQHLYLPASEKCRSLISPGARQQTQMA